MMHGGEKQRDGNAPGDDAGDGGRLRSARTMQRQRDAYRTTRNRRNLFRDPNQGRGLDLQRRPRGRRTGQRHRIDHRRSCLHHDTWVWSPRLQTKKKTKQRRTKDVSETADRSEKEKGKREHHQPTLTQHCSHVTRDAFCTERETHGKIRHGVKKRVVIVGVK
jgi:hypothetical protein